MMLSSFDPESASDIIIPFDNPSLSVLNSDWSSQMDSYLVFRQLSKD